MSYRRSVAATALGSAAGLAFGVAGPAVADANASATPGHAKQEQSRPRARTDVVPGVTISWPSNCINHSGAPTHVGGFAVAAAIASCTTKKRWREFVTLYRDRFFGWSQLATGSNFVASRTYDTLTESWACRGVGTYTYKNAYAVFLSNPHSPSKVAHRSGSPTARFTC